MSLQGSDKRPGGQGAQEGPSLVDPWPNARILSIDRVKDTPKETLECFLSTALRSEDVELDQILSAIEKFQTRSNQALQARGTLTVRFSVRHRVR
jgi:hypothetical protein